MIIVLEGLEGVGKTTLSKMISSALPAEYLKSPPPDLNLVRGYYSEINDKSANFYFYLSGLAALQEQIKPFKGSENHLVIDRYIDSTIAYHADGVNFTAPAYESSAFLVPDLKIHITCPEQDRLDRMQNRGFHIFDRPKSDEKAIRQYFSENSHTDYENVGDLDQSASKLVDLIDQWFLK